MGAGIRYDSTDTADTAIELTCLAHLPWGSFQETSVTDFRLYTNNNNNNNNTIIYILVDGCLAPVGLLVISDYSK